MGVSELGSALGTRDGKLLGGAGMMTKEKLMLLIGSVPCFGEEHVAACPDRIMGSCGQAVRMDFCAIQHMADWLIANGVVVREKGEWKYYRKQGIAVCTSCSFERKVDDNFGMAVACPICGADMRKGENG